MLGVIIALGAAMRTQKPVAEPEPGAQLAVVTSPLPTTTSELMETFMPIATSTATSSFPQIDIALSPYVEVIDSCGPYYSGEPCVNMRSGPGTEYPIIAKLRKGVVLKVSDIASTTEGQWYAVYVDDVIVHPERVFSDWYVSADAVQLFYDDGDHYLSTGDATTQKHILIDLSDETLSAYDGNTLYMQEKISRGLDKTPTPIGTFHVLRKTPSRYMQGPIPGKTDDTYDLPGVPWNMYFTNDGAAIHGTYWHDHFGQPWSHGCINLPPDTAHQLYEWAPVGTVVTVQE
jgi:hypothetical protein